ncbi:hypothetical protein DWG18_02460 [Lysobacter sp. TY2-98]|uniref:hypothetical protein n=1 Tax=Lysobacter sp. TY2-98 TaxID=2290922 RepID=UPI000E20BC71|nr:hypothetical protein [Lysobacter sp. TY2-98]AXK71262.1 hypothetical protein DWG18_02460 [Lysobacter sp. TY2-98]
MSNAFKMVFGASLVAMLAGCATAPANYSVSNSRTYDKSYDEVWEQIVAAFASRNIQVKNIAKDSGVIYAEAARFDDSMADCGKPGLFMVQGRRANFNVFVSRSAGKPTVSVNTEFSETRRFENNVFTVPCNSKGVLEGMILNSIQ